jgi:cytochrome b
MQRATRRVKVWDGWVRLTHWSIVVLLAVSVGSGLAGEWDLHLPSGYALLTLVLFRLIWGLVGSESARFTRFLKGPRAALAHLAGFGRVDEPDREATHNPAGGWMVLLLLLLLLAQAGSGLFADDQILTRGPLARAVPAATSDTATWLHLRLFWVILGAAALHVLAVLGYFAMKGHDLVSPMLTGSKQLPDDVPAPRLAHPALAAALLAAVSFLVYVISQAD